jgi:hypothetical protein
MAWHSMALHFARLILAIHDTPFVLHLLIFLLCLDGMVGWAGGNVSIV